MVNNKGWEAARTSNWLLVSLHNSCIYILIQLNKHEQTRILTWTMITNYANGYEPTAMVDYDVGNFLAAHIDDCGLHPRLVHLPFLENIPEMLKNPSLHPLEAPVLRPPLATSWDRQELRGSLTEQEKLKAAAQAQCLGADAAPSVGGSKAWFERWWTVVNGGGIWMLRMVRIGASSGSLHLVDS